MTSPLTFETAMEELTASGWGVAAPLFLQLWQASLQNLKIGLMAGAGLLNTGRADEGAALLSHLADAGHIIRTAQYNAAVSPALRQASKEADSAIRAAFTRVQRDAIEECADAGRIASALWPQTHAGPQPFPKNTVPPDRTRPRPYVFFATELPPVNIFETADWAQSLSQKTGDIRSEYLNLMAQSAHPGAPYVDANAEMGADWTALKGQDAWTAVHLFKDGAAQDGSAACPLTCRALESLPITRQSGVPIEAFFSVLAPGTTIPPHYGLANCRVTVHLPLIVPSADPKVCGIRVGEATRGWREGEPFIFDDSFDHSAWNTSSETRVVLIFEAWRPDMSAGEIAAVQASYEAREAYLKARSEIVRKLAKGGA